MKTREEREKFEESLTGLIKKYSVREDIFNQIVEKLDTKLTKGYLSRVWSGNRQLVFLSDMELLLFSQAFYEILEKTEESEKINPKNIFSDNEFNESLHFGVLQKVKKDSVTFKNVTRVYQEKLGWIYHVPAVDCYTISDMSTNDVSNYNFQAQREAIIKELFGNEIKIPKIFPEKIDSIAEKILTGDYYPVDTIVINVLSTGAEKVEFVPTLDDNIGDLTIYKVKGSTNDIVDGMNRVQSIVKACALAKEKNIKIDVKFKVDIINVPLKNSNDCIVQINAQTPLENDRVKALEPSKFMTIATNVNRYENRELNVLHGRIAESLTQYKDLNKISTIQIFAESLEDHYKDLLEKNNPSAYRDILEYQVDFFNEFFSNYIDNLENVEATKKQTVLFDINMFYCYIYISKTLYELYQDNEKQWRRTVKKISRSLDFNKTNTEWEKLRTTGKLVPKAKEQLVDFLNSKLNKINKEDEVALSV